ncbi:MAG: hemolysin III family protein [Gammaproteobacteria bacterium]|nr:hemolysin III family protein [Gammaproteobacteria bacterium]MCP4090906.1 hemolysin III family protein [Gammaproteobacteria bacterium]MCP4275193.1 hemolysin III family protein [Gammaproteobacteria bacterium]MCP4830797.1 hemolysin III family protein [Gammaproteobacteria bacterium]MCP4929586.1 hemolysin III family protein [Gammaproteobacteria bacterium]
MYYGEKLNSITSMVGAAFALIALGSLLTVAVQIGTAVAIISFGTFGLSLILLYSMSTFYHSVQEPRLKHMFMLLDHIAIYLLIVGTYTPFMLMTLQGANGILIFSLVWALAVIGIFTELFLSGLAVKIGQLTIFLGMGWACAIELDSLRELLPAEGFFWLVTGGIAYTAGVVFYVLDEINWLKHAHGIWHFFVMSGSVAHFISVIGFVR